MTTTTPSPPTVVKWPFFAGDGLCVATMVAILALADRPVSGGITAAAVVCLLVGVVLAIMPYLMEYEARLRMAEASAHAPIDIQIRKAAGFAEQLNHSVSRSQSTAEEIEKVLASNEESMEKLAEQVETIGQWMIGDGAPGGGDSSGLVDSLKSVETGIQKLSQATADLAGREYLTPERLQSALTELNQRLDAAFENLKKTAGDAPTPPVPNDSTVQPKEPSRKRRSAGSAKPDPADPAVPTDTGETPGDSTTAEKGADGGSQLDSSEPGPGEPRFTFNEKSTSLIATAYIGIGNKLFLRGEGPGLSWEEGVPMQSLSIGKWGWSALEVDEPITCRIYKNDDEPAIDGDIVLNPAELKEISPRF